MGDWPWPQDTAQDRLRRIAESYRLALLGHAPDVCASLDEQMVEFGQRWICSDTIIDSERLVTAAEVAEEFGVNDFNVRDWSRRHPDMIPKRGKRGNRTLYRLGDILSYQAQGPRR